MEVKYNNPWEEIDLSDYESHMSLEGVMQLQGINEMIKEQLYCHPANAVMILGVAGGNGLEHIDADRLERVYGVDINRTYLDQCVRRYPELDGVLELVRADLTDEQAELPGAELVIANLFVEYIGYESFQKALGKIKPEYVSCIIQINTDDSFVSDSPYLHVFDRLNEVHHEMSKEGMTECLYGAGYKFIDQKEKHMPNGKMLLRLDYEKSE